ncbi:hypothetical protein ISTM_343 [Insectomime virus]|nr:hypothetical protein ISTM_343 [Insectomime virus]
MIGQDRRDILHFLYQKENMTYRQPAPIENFEAAKFSKKIGKQIELVDGKLLLAKERMGKCLEEEYHKQYRRINYLERYRLWLEECLQDLDDIHKGVPWKHETKCGSIWGRRVSPDWYEWEDPSIEKVPEPYVVRKGDDNVKKEKPTREIRQVSKQEALSCLGYSQEFIEALRL